MHADMLRLIDKPGCEPVQRLFRFACLVVESPDCRIQLLDSSGKPRVPVGTRMWNPGAPYSTSQFPVLADIPRTRSPDNANPTGKGLWFLTANQRFPAKRMADWMATFLHPLLFNCIDSSLRMVRTTARRRALLERRQCARFRSTTRRTRTTNAFGFASASAPAPSPALSDLLALPAFQQLVRTSLHWSDITPYSVRGAKNPKLFEVFTGTVIPNLVHRSVDQWRKEMALG